MLASLAGAFAAHLLLLLLVVALPRAHSAASAAAANRPAAGPREVAVDLGELMKRLERERAEEEAAKVEAKPKPEPPAPVRPFVATDTNRPEAAAPENAPFESDRNTSAASRLRPDESLPQHATPTLAGESPLPHLSLADRDHVDGPLDAMPASPDPRERGENAGRPGPAAALGLAPATAVAMAAEAPAAAIPEATAPDRPPLPAVPPAPSTAAAAAGRRADTPFSVNPGRSGFEEAGAARETSYFDANARIEAPSLPEGEDRAAAGTGSGEEGEATMESREPDPLPSATEEGAVPEAPGEIPAADAIPEPAPSAPEPPEPVAAPAVPAVPAVPAAPDEGAKPADEGLFAKGFSPEERQNVINGSLAEEGADAVDAIDTPVGRYKKAVRDAISQRWHRYRQDNADFVTWGILKLEFSVDASGRVRDLEITKNEANAMLAEFTLKAIREAKLPPMPEDVAKSLGSRGLVIQYDIIIY